MAVFASGEQEAEAENQYVWPSLSRSAPLIASPVRAWVTVRLDHQATSCAVSGPRLLK
ncbi:MAG TPA: hypothetical protein VGF67_24130 [Ktedonobacteraceae bacterium]